MGASSRVRGQEEKRINHLISHDYKSIPGKTKMKLPADQSERKANILHILDTSLNLHVNHN
jgi:hypothetical protein